MQRDNAEAAAAKARDRIAMKATTVLIKRNQLLSKKDPNRKSIERIVKEANQTYGSNINSRTAGRYVREGYIGQSPRKQGPIGDVPKRMYGVLKGAYATYLKLEQAESKKQSNVKHMAKLVNAAVNKTGFNKSRDDLARRLQRDTANQFEVGKANSMWLSRDVCSGQPHTTLTSGLALGKIL